MLEQLENIIIEKNEIEEAHFMSNFKLFIKNIYNSLQ